MKRIYAFFQIASLLFTSCDLLNLGNDETPGDGNYGILTISERNDLVPQGWMPEGDMVFKIRNQYTNNSQSIQLGISEDANNKVSLIFGSTPSYSCVSDGNFCNINPTTGHPAIGITIVESISNIGQYRANGGTVFYESLDPLIVRFERIYMVPESYDGNGASGSFYLDGTLYAEKD